LNLRLQDLLDRLDLWDRLDLVDLLDRPLALQDLLDLSARGSPADLRDLQDLLGQLDLPDLEDPPQVLAGPEDQLKLPQLRRTLGRLRSIALEI
jgi:hypothetical protein